MSKILKYAKWIASPTIDTVPAFTSTIDIDKDVKKIKLDITAMGFYRVYINNIDITTNLFMPGYTQYKYRVQAQEYDVSKYFKLGNNDIKILLGNGWGGSKHFGWVHGNHPYFDASLIYLFSVVYSNETKYYGSNDNVDVYTSNVLFSEIYDGEIQDNNLIPTYVGKAKVVDIKTKIVKQEGLDIVEGEHIYPKRMFTTPNGELLIDFGQNFTGYINVIIKGNKGEKISFIPAEILDKDGNFYNENYRSAKSLFSYTLTGDLDNFKPLFSFQGLQYIKLLEYPKDVNINNFVGIMVHSNLVRTGNFVCGNELINQLYHNIIYGQLSNYLDIPTDCPQRDERLGWLGDAQVFCRTASINFNVHDFFKKWLHDMALDQYDNGALEGVSPRVGGLPTGISCGWGDACCICPWEVYLAYGDETLLKENYPMMTKWIGYILGECKNKPYIWDSGNHYGDWLAQDGAYGESVGSTRIDLLSTAFFAYSTSLVIKASEVLGYDTAYYNELYNNIKKAFINAFIKDGKPVGSKALLNYKGERTCYTQTALSIILHFNLCEEKDKSSLAKLLADLIKENNMLMTTGFLGTPYILHALSDNGYSDIAYNLLFQTQKPSWLFSVLRGATTIWEHWDGVDEEGNFWSAGMNSFNHYAYGAVYDWIFSNSLGIKLIKPCYEEIQIMPIPDKRLGFVKGGIQTKYGYLESSWYYQNDTVIYEYIIPRGITAKVKLPNKEIIKLEAGKYSFRV